MGLSGATTRARAGVLGAALAGAMFVGAAFASVASADTWGCLSSLNNTCQNVNPHHSAYTGVNYAGSGLPLLAGSICFDAACNWTGWVYEDDTGKNGEYDHFVACFVGDCSVNERYLGHDTVSNQHTSQHNITGYDGWV